jgi:hypothetical protein
VWEPDGLAMGIVGHSGHSFQTLFLTSVQTRKVLKTPPNPAQPCPRALEEADHVTFASPRHRLGQCGSSPHGPQVEPEGICHLGRRCQFQITRGPRIDQVGRALCPKPARVHSASGHYGESPRGAFRRSPPAFFLLVPTVGLLQNVIPDPLPARRPQPASVIDKGGQRRQGRTRQAARAAACLTIDATAV